MPSRKRANSPNKNFFSPPLPYLFSLIMTLKLNKTIPLMQANLLNIRSKFTEKLYHLLFCGCLGEVSDVHSCVVSELVGGRGLIRRREGDGEEEQEEQRQRQQQQQQNHLLNKRLLKLSHLVLGLVVLLVCPVSPHSTRPQPFT